MDIGIIVTGFIGLVSTGFSWFLARKKYNAEVQSSEIDNLKKALEFYDKIVKDTDQKLKEYIHITKENRTIMYNLQNIMYELLNEVCVDNSCVLRKRYPKEQFDKIMKSISTSNNINVATVKYNKK